MNVKDIYHLLSKKMEVTIATKPEIKVYSFPPFFFWKNLLFFYPVKKVTHKPESRHPRAPDRNSTSIDWGLNCWAGA